MPGGFGSPAIDLLSDYQRAIPKDMMQPRGKQTPAMRRMDQKQFSDNGLKEKLMRGTDIPHDNGRASAMLSLR